MSGLALQLKTLVRSARRKTRGELRFIGIRSQSRDELPNEIPVGDETWRVLRVRSALEARMALLDAGEDGRALLVTPLPEQDLGLEVVARLATRQLQDLQPWQLVREQFQARRLDPRVVRQGAWMASELLENAPAEGYPPASSGLLDLDTVWTALFPRLGLAGARPGMAELIAASAAGGFGARWESADEEFRAAARQRLVESAGSAGELAGAALDAGHGDELAPLGLVLDLLLADEVRGQPKALVVRTRLERFGLHVEDMALVEPWAREAVRWVRGALESDGNAGQCARAVLESADRHLEVLGARELAAASGVLRSGFEARMARLAEALLSAAGPNGFDREAAEPAFGLVGGHLLPEFDQRLAERRGRAHDALRLARWLSNTPAEPDSLAVHAERYRDEGAFVDRARLAIGRGEGDSELKAVYGKLVELADARRAGENRAFAERLARVSAGDEGPGELLPIEEALTRVVAPLAKHIPVLLVVMDGMSEAITDELVGDLLSRSSYQRMSPDAQERLPVMVGLLPSVTEVCRTSLLCGAPRVGAQAEELEGFEELALRHGWRGRATKQRILFHKAQITGKNLGLASEVNAAIDSSAKVVAVVVNAVDDQLSKGDQLRLDWKLGRVPVLQELVHQAELAGRALVLTSDHGHVVETGASCKVGSEGNDGRWRPVSGRLEEGEIEIHGARVLKPEVGGSCVLPWSEDVRYSNPHAGYHGGVSPQEVVTPLVVLVPGLRSADLEGWSAEVHERPWWWDGPEEREVPRPVVRRVRPTPPARKPAKMAQPTPTMFPDEVPVAAAADGPGWMSELFASPTWADQRRLAGRKPPKDDDVADVLGALAGAGGKLSLEALRNRTRFTVPRLRGLLTAMSRVLNVEGYAVLEVDYDSGEVQLATGLLFSQFAIDGEGEE